MGKRFYSRIVTNKKDEIVFKNFCERDLDENGYYEIPDGVVEIAPYAFAMCYKLKNIKIPKSVKVINENAFSSCRNLRKIEIPEGVCEISTETFENCKSLEEVYIPSSVKDINYRAFFNCQSLKKITLPDSLECIQNETFYNCVSLKEVLFPAQIIGIGSSAFEKCKLLQSVKLPQQLNYINGYAFHNCLSLEKVDMPKNIGKFSIVSFDSNIMQDWEKKMDDIYVFDSRGYYELSMTIAKYKMQKEHFETRCKELERKVEELEMLRGDFVNKEQSREK